MNMNSSSEANFGAGVGMGVGMGAVTRNRYHFVFEGDLTITHRDGRVEHKARHEEIIENLTTTEGRTEMLDKFFKGAAYTAAWYMGLISNTSVGTLAQGDTAAKITTSAPSTPTTNDWSESTGYSEATRQAITFGTAASASVDSSAAPAVFTINTSVTLYGAFCISQSTKGGTTGKIYGEGAFSSTIALSSGTVSVYVTLTIASA